MILNVKRCTYILFQRKSRGIYISVCKLAYEASGERFIGSQYFLFSVRVNVFLKKERKGKERKGKERKGKGKGSKGKGRKQKERKEKNSYQALPCAIGKDSRVLRQTTECEKLLR